MGKPMPSANLGPDGSEELSHSLLSLNVNERTEKKGGLTYLSWAWAWAEALKFDPQATWVTHTFGSPGGEEPFMRIGDTAMVHTSVTLKGIRRDCMLPVMDNRNNAVKNPDARKVSDAIMRCMTKALAMHGLGLYIYAGEDLPLSDADEEPHAITPEAVLKSGRKGVVGDVLACNPALSPVREDYIDSLASDLIREAEENGRTGESLWQAIKAENIDDDIEKLYLWSLLPSKIRSGIKAAQAAERENA